MNQELASMREQYGDSLLDESSIKPNPFDQFKLWFQEALASGLIKEVNAMTLATVDEDNHPDARIVLLKECTDSGFVFYTNFSSAKGNQIELNQSGCLVFGWVELQKQIRIKGNIIKYNVANATSYFQSRPRESQIAAWASPQSKTIKDRNEIESLFAENEKLFINTDPLPKPPTWGGYILIPHTIEFWQGRRNRLHDRLKYTLKENVWSISRLAP